MKRILRQHLRRNVLVTLKSGVAFGGVLFEADSEAFVLRNAALLEAAGNDRVPTPVDGEMVVLRADIAYLQFT